MTRPYDSPVRRDRAAETRSRVIETAYQLLLSDGVAAMTVASLAKAAGVSPQTVYNAVGGKAEVIKATYDVTLAGDRDPTPMSERPAFRAIQEAPDLDAFARAYAHWVADIYERVGPLLGVLLFYGAGGDPALETFIATIQTERRTGNANGVRALAARGLLPADVDTDQVIDAVWTLTAPESWHRLMVDRSWPRATYEAWLARHLRLALDHP